MNDPSSIESLIEACKRKDAKAQKALFMKMYNYSMSIASQYANSRMETEEIAQDGLYKMFKSIESFKEHIPFKLWLRRIIINCSIDHYRKYHKKHKLAPKPMEVSINLGEERLESEYLLKCIQSLSPAYRMVFNLFVIEGFSHKEIAKKLKITEGTSKSNLSKARKNLKHMITSLKTKEG